MHVPLAPPPLVAVLLIHLRFVTVDARFYVVRFTPLITLRTPHLPAFTTTGMHVPVTVTVTLNRLLVDLPRYGRLRYGYVVAHYRVWYGCWTIYGWLVAR